MYTFKENIPREEFSAFVSEFSFAPVQQTEAWSGLKNNWKPFFCGLYFEEKLVGVSLILVRKMLPFFYYAYCPRGPLIDFSDKDAVEAFKNGVFEFCRKRKIYSFTADPQIVVGKILPDLPENAYYDPFDVEKGKRELDNLVSSGFIHQGFGKELHSSLQPRYNAFIPLKSADGKPLSFDLLKKNFKTKIRKYYANFQAARGLFYERAEASKENIATFRRIIGNTEERQKISLRGEEYFSLLADNFGDNAFFGFEKCDVGAYIENLRERLEKEPENEGKINEQIADSEKVISARGNTVPLAALLTVYPPNKKGITVAEYLYAGSDLTVFPSFSATLCGLGDQCVYCIEKNIDFLNLGGLAGTLDDGLYTFKRQFSPIIVEYAGEFELPVNKFKYSLMKKGLPVMMKVYKRLRGKK